MEKTRKLTVLISIFLLLTGCVDHGHPTVPDVRLKLLKTVSLKADAKVGMMINDTDGGFLIAGSLQNSTGDKGFIVKTDNKGNKAWVKYYSFAIQYLKKNTGTGYILAEYGPTGCKVYITDDNADIQQTVTYGASSSYFSQDPGFFAERTADNNFVISVLKKFADGGSYGFFEVYISKIDPSGNVIWEYNFLTSNSMQSQATAPSRDGGYYIAANNKTYDSVVTYMPGPVILFKISGNGAVLWTNNSLTDADSRLNAMCLNENLDDTVIISCQGSRSFLTVKTDNLGNVISTKPDTPRDVAFWGVINQAIIAQGNITLMAATNYHFMMGGPQEEEAVVGYIDENVINFWQNITGGKGTDSAKSVVLSLDGAYVISAGDTSSFSVTGNSEVYISEMDTLGRFIW